MATEYYIDGYNVAHYSKSLRQVVQRDLERAREMLIDRVAQFCITTSHEAYLVFDGRGQFRAETTPHYRHVDHLHVVYTPYEQTADAWIERRVYTAADKLNVCVVTNDRGIRDLCGGMGALTMDANKFLQTIGESTQDVREVIRRTSSKDTGFVEDRLSGDSLEALKRLRDQL